MMNMLKACYDWRVITALAAVGAGVFLLAPNLIGAALPLLLVAICPLSMILMMRTMGGHEMNAVDRAVPASSADRVDRLRAELAASRREQQRIAQELEQLETETTMLAATAEASPPRA